MKKLSLEKQLKEILEDYKDEVLDALKEEQTPVVTEAVKMLKASSPKKRGKYASGWGYTTTKETPAMKQMVIHNKTHAGLTHLLERGHATRSGGRTVAQVHIKPVEEWSMNEYERRLIDRLS